MDDFHNKVRETVCDYIEFYDYDVTPFLKKRLGREYLNMRKSSVWATETEIMATVKMFARDVFIWFDNKWLHYSYLREPSKDAITSITDMEDISMLFCNPKISTCVFIVICIQVCVFPYFLLYKPLTSKSTQYSESNMH